MTRRRASSLLMRVSLLGAAAVAVSGAAVAERALTLSYKEQPGFARITARWADGSDEAPRMSASVANQVLVVHFDQPVSVDLEALAEGLPSWAAVTRMDADGQTVRIGLKQAARVHASTSIDLTAVDLVPENAPSDPPDIVSPLVAKRAAEEQAKKQAAIPPPPPVEPLEVRGSQAGESSRLAFYWPSGVTYKVVGEAPGELKLLFSKRAKPDLAYIKIDPPANLADFSGENTPKGYLVTVTSRDAMPIRHFMDGHVPVVDITPAAPVEPAAQAIEEAEADEGAAGQKTVAVSLNQPAPAKPAPAPQKAAPAAKTPEAGRPAQLTPTVATQDGAEADAETPATAPPDIPPDIIGGPERVTVMRAAWHDPAPRSGVVDAKARALPNGLELSVTFETEAPAAVFFKGGGAWAVFAANADIRVDRTTLPAGFDVRSERTKNATILRINPPKGLTLSAIADGPTWKIRLAPSAQRPDRFLKVERGTDENGRSVTETMLPGAAGIVWFEDPVVGDRIAAVVAYPPATASATPRESIEALLPATAHGFAVEPRSDDVEVWLEGERVRVAVMKNYVSSVDGMDAAGLDLAAPPGTGPAFIDFVKWGGLEGEAWYTRREDLERASMRFDPASPEGSEALLALAQFYIGHDMGAEAIGVLDLAGAYSGALNEEPSFQGLKAVANILAHRNRDAEEVMSRGRLRNDPSAALWMGYAAAEQGEWEKAAEKFRESEEERAAYSGVRAAAFAARFALAAYHVNDFNTARREAAFAIANGDPDTVALGEFVDARLDAAIDGPGAAYAEFDKLSKSPVEAIAVRAELRRIEAGVASGKITPNEAADQLESLRFRWRGDDVELETVGILADQYMRSGKFRDALSLAKSAAMRDPSAPGARDLRIRLTDYFRRLYLNGEADRLEPIQALALFYEFSDLTPIGSDGDQMIRKLAQRLVAFDLLEPAEKLLQHQVDNRMRGMSKSAIAVDLATVYLFDSKPERALAALNSTRQPGMPRKLALERRMLEAAAYRDLGRFENVEELMEPLDTPESRALLSDAYLRSRKWSDAARVLFANLPPAAQAGPADAPAALKAAIAARMSKDPQLIARARGYLGAFKDGDPNRSSFDLITSQTDVAGASLSEAVRRMADAQTVDAFAAAMKARFESPQGAAERAGVPTEAPTGG
ncbi:MAG: hypothetical protein R3C52_07165 [Hyphomonadaceae bacterium]